MSSSEPRKRPRAPQWVPLISFVARRVIVVAVQVLIAVVGVFVLLRLLIDPVGRFIGLFPTKQAYSKMNHELGLDHSIWVQLGSYFGRLGHFDFGISWVSGDPVRNELWARLPVTLQLVGLGFALSLAVAVPLGVIAAARPGGRADRWTAAYALFAGAQPDFWWGLVFIYIFSFKLGWAPAALGIVDVGTVVPTGPTKFILVDSLIHGEVGLFFSALHHLSLGVITFAFVNLGWVLKVTRQAALDVLASDYVLYARASGYSPKSVRRMAVRNGFAPVLTVAGILLAVSLAGTVVIETVFSLNGIGVYALRSTLNVDFPAVQGAVITLTFLALLIYLVMDVCHALIDPRVQG